MYLEHYGLHELPFRITPHTDFFFSGANRGATLEALLYAITHDEGIVKISGEVGSGKTMLSRVLMERLPENVVIIYLANPSLSREDILYALADELGIEVPEHSRTNTVMRALQEKLVALYADGRQVVVLIDEAHAMPVETLEEIRLLSNLESNRHKLLQLVLFGQPELDQTLARPDMRQLLDRITQNFRLEPLVREDVEQYLSFRMQAAGYRGPNVFSPPAVQAIAKASQGLTRRINILADKSLLAAFAREQHMVGAPEAEAAIKDAAFGAIPVAATGKPAGMAMPLLWASAGALIALLAIFLFGRIMPPAPPPAPPPVAQPELPALPVTPATPAAALAPPAASTSFAEKLADSRTWLKSAPDSHWVIQLYTVNDNRRPEVERFLALLEKQGMDMEQVRIYQAEAGGLGRYGVFYGDFASQSETTKTLQNLPELLKPYQPYSRRIRALK